MLAKRDSYGDTTISKRWIVAIFLMFFLFTIRSSLPTIQVSVKHHEYDDDSKISAPPEEPSIPEPPPFITDNVAVIIEDRPFDTLVPLLLHFSSVLGPGWPIVLYTSQEIIPTSPPIQRAIEERRLSIRRLPIDVRFESQDAVSEFLTMSWLWEQLAPAGHVLLFQADSIICSNAPQTVSSFLDYDWVGAPIDSTMGYGEGYNGGLSLRNRSLILDIIDQNSFRNERLTSQDPENPTVQFEDQWFVKKMRDLGARLPSLEVAKTFAVETLWYEMPLGFHQAARYQSEENLQVAYRYCPEYRIATGGAF